MKKNVADAYLESLIRNQILERRTVTEGCCGEEAVPGSDGKGELLAPRGYEPEGSAGYRRAAERMNRIFLEAGFAFVSLKEAASQIERKDAEEIAGLMIRRRQIVQISGDYYTIPQISDQIRRRIREKYRSGEIITIIQIKDMFDVSRKNAKLILDYMENMGIVKQTGAQSERQMR